MILGKNTLRYGFYVAIVALILTLTNFFNQVQRNEVIEDVINLSQLVLYVTFIATGFIAARPLKDRGVATAALNGAIAALIVGLGLIAVVALTESVDVRFVFRNLQPLRNSSLMLGQEEVGAAMPLLALAAALFGVIGGLMTYLSDRVLTTIIGVVGGVTIMGVLQGQIDKVITLSDALTLLLAFGLAYVAANFSGVERVRDRVLIGAGVGFGVALIFGGLAVWSGMERGTILRGGGTLVPTILNLPLQSTLHAVVFAIGLTLVGAAGAAVTTAGRGIHNAAWYVIAAVLSLGVLASQRGMSLTTAAIIAAIFGITQWMLPDIGSAAHAAYHQLSINAQRTAKRPIFLAGLVLLLALPSFIGLSLTNTLNLMMIYIIMGVGMNVMIGYAGLLDLGYVASFAIGAYTTGLLTTPSMLTCGGVSPDQVRALELTVSEACRGILTFWQAWPIAIIVSALTGMALGVPVLRLRGDYLAIVTLGFGEIINRLVNSSVFKDLLGGPQGVNGIPVPNLNLSFINPDWNFQLARSTEIYYLFLFTVAVGTIVVLRLVNTRLGRAWRALRDDEDVAEATGIHLVGAKLLAFGISSAFSGMGGALFGASLQGIYPNSFTLNVSIFVLSLVIVGGMGSIPAVFVGALVLIGLPEMLRELQDYRLLAFGVLLVVVMLSKPEGILPPQTPKLSEKASARQPAPAAGD
jgi:ABC-type branched-subunit amino acid transport system permease subunit